MRRRRRRRSPCVPSTERHPQAAFVAIATSHMMVLKPARPSQRHSGYHCKHSFDMRVHRRSCRPHKQAQRTTHLARRCNGAPMALLPRRGPELMDCQSLTEAPRHSPGCVRSACVACMHRVAASHREGIYQIRPVWSSLKKKAWQTASRFCVESTCGGGRLSPCPHYEATRRASIRYEP